MAGFETYLMIRHAHIFVLADSYERRIQQLFATSTVNGHTIGTQQKITFANKNSNYGQDRQKRYF